MKNQSALDKKDFLSYISSKIRISQKNLFLNFKTSLSLSSSFSHLPAKSSVSAMRKNKYSASNAKVQDLHACFLLFITQSMRNILADIEVIKFKQTCLNIISTLDNPNEGHFGLVKIYCFEDKYKEAIHHLKILIESDQQDISYLIWMAVIKSLLARTSKQALKVKTLCQKCLKQQPSSIEILWTMMKVSLTGLLSDNEIEKPEYYASRIIKVSHYYGYLAWSQLVNDRKQQVLLEQLINEYPSFPECYLLSWNYFYNKSKKYPKALEVIEKAYISVKDSKDYEVLIGLNYAKTLEKIGNVEKAIELLQVEYSKRSVYTIYLYHYSRICVKSGLNVFLGSAIGALTECLNICSESKHPFILFWLSRAYERLNEKILAFKSIQKSLVSFSRLLESKPAPTLVQKINQKINTLKQMLESNQIDSKILPRIKFILTNFNNSMIEEFSTLIKLVKEYDSHYGEILESQALWKFDYKTDSLKSLYNSFKTTRVQMKSFFLMVKYLSEENDYSNIKKICEKMIQKCKSPCIPVQVWIKVHLVFAKTLTRLNDIPKAILIYKCLAQVQPTPYISDLLYTMILQQATTIEDLMDTTTVVNKIKSQYPDLKFKRVQLLNSKRNLSSIVIADDEKEIQNSRQILDDNKQLIGSRTPEPMPKARFSKTPGGDNANPGFSVSIFYKFLYKIGKVSAKFNQNIEDGLLAMHDFLILHHYWMKEGIESDELVKAKALYWMGVLYHYSDRFQEAAATFKESLCMLFQLGLDDMTQKVQKALKEYSYIGCS